MKKVKTVFVVDRLTDLATDVVNLGSEWVFNGEGLATVKFDGTAAMIKNGLLFKRLDRGLRKNFLCKLKRDRKNFSFDMSMLKDVPVGSIPCESEPDPFTFHFPHWVPVNFDLPENKYFKEAFFVEGKVWTDGTYELVGKTVNGNVELLDGHELWKHGEKIVEIKDRTFTGLKKFLTENEMEGVVFHRENGDMAKIRRKDVFNFKRKVGNRKIDWRNDNIIFD